MTFLDGLRNRFANEIVHGGVQVVVVLRVRKCNPEGFKRKGWYHCWLCARDSGDGLCNPLDFGLESLPRGTGSVRHTRFLVDGHLLDKEED